MASQNPFDILQLEEHASDSQIRERYLLMSRTFHPDKQPLANYHTTKRYFENIDKAYKSISTGFRKYVFNKFGLDGINLLERFADQFTTLEGKEQTEEGKQEIDQLVFHLYFADKRDYYNDQGRVQAFTILDISPLFRGSSKVVSANYLFPVVSKLSGTYMFAGPNILGFQNNVVFSLDSTKQNRNVDARIMSTRRIYNSWLLKNVFSYGSEGVSQQTSLQYHHSPTLTARCTLLNYENGNFYLPRVGIDKRFQNGLQFSAQTNLQSTNFQMYIVGKEQKSTNANISANFRGGSLLTQASFDNYLSEFCRFVVEFQSDLSGNQASFGVNYGISADFGDDFKIDLISHWSRQNYFDIKLTVGKYTFRMPVICINLTTAEFQGLKVSSMVTFYVMSRLLFYFKRSSTLKKQKLKVQSFARLNQQKSKEERVKAQIAHQEERVVDFEHRTHGLVVLAAYVGNTREVHNISKNIDKMNIDMNSNLGHIRSQLKFNDNEQVVDVTTRVQVLVKGARITSQKLLVFNPCFDQTQQPSLLIHYLLRGKAMKLIQKVSQPIQIGIPKEPHNNLVSNAITWLRKVHLIQ